ncbi:MAG: DUF4011 domain-containing protein [Planctomycetota bacterium]|nr:DUF4011 domain-containing protein [Planctomycetota bacterium]
MSDIQSSLETARRELLDLSLRNRLLNHRLPRARGVQVSDEQPAAVYRLLWDEERRMSFLPREGATEAGEGDDPSIPPPPGESLPERHRDSKLQTVHPPTRLQARLLATARDARTVEEDHGVNALFLALGFLRWREAEAPADTWRLAPLCLLPVRLERARADAQFVVFATDSEPIDNLTLRVKLEREGGIALPELPDCDGLDLEEWFAAVQRAVARQPGWEVERRIVLDLFAFGRFLMWHDLDPQAWPAGAGPAQQPLVQRLFGGGFAPLPTLPEDLDALRPPEASGEVLESDGSQARVLAAVAAGADLVIQGPPGTGKSQTICNLIAEAVLRGQTVLFVAEKQAALAVVQRRLAAIGLGDCCLELHSDAASKRAVLAELGRTLALPAPPPPPAADPAYARLRQDLNAFARAMRAPIGSRRLSPGEALDQLAEISVPAADLPREAWTGLDAAASAACEQALQEAATALAASGPLSAHPWGIARLATVLPAQERRLDEAVRQAQSAVAAARPAAQRLAEALGAPRPSGPLAAERLVAAAQALAARPALPFDPESPLWTEQRDAVAVLFAAGECWHALRTRHAATLSSAAWNAEIAPLRQAFADFGDSPFRWASPAWWRARAALARYCLPGKRPAANSDRLRLCDDILRAQAQRRSLEQEAMARLGRALFGAQWLGSESDWPALVEARDWSQRWREGRAAGWPPCRVLDPGAARSALAAGEAAISAALAALRALCELLACPLPDDDWERWQQRLQGMGADPTAIHEVCAVNRALAPLPPAIAEAVRRWTRPASELVPACKAAELQALLEQAIAERPELARFDPHAHQRAAARFRELDLAVLAANRARVRAAHHARLPATDERGPAAVLRREAAKKMRHVPLRTLFAEAASAVQRVKPVFLMSPLSVAAYLPPGRLTFDLVVFDEASQVRPVDAVGAIARARQLVVVGDSKQMPPTTFFERLLAPEDGSEGEEEAAWTGGLESLLDLCLAGGCPSLMLCWHYRSRHPSLIAVSNREFYEGRLLTFPSPAGPPHPDGDGLSLIHLPQAVYDRARTRTNPAEAEAVADAVMDHARRWPGLSLGVAAFSQAQMLAIAAAVERRRRADPSLEGFFAAHPHEPFFVKNLENVQGDERDVIFVSIGYGRDREGQVHLNFGPLNAEGGERRLNVLITRARRRLRVYTNLLPEDLDAARTQAAGVRALREFLAYARDGGQRAADGGRLRGVARRLCPAEGVPVATGGIAFRLGQLAVRCDDQEWCLAATCRDRERLHDEVLQGLGWQVHHAWRLAWWRRPEAEARRLAAARSSGAGKEASKQG